MPPKATDAEKLLLLTLTLESAIAAENWSEVNDTIRARQDLLEGLTEMPNKQAEEILWIEDRMLTTLRKRLIGVRADMRNLTAALRIAVPYGRENHGSSISLAG